MNNHKQCAGECQLIKSVSEFHRAASKPDGRQPLCKECRKIKEEKPRAKKGFFCTTEQREVWAATFGTLDPISPKTRVRTSSDFAGGLSKIRR